VNFVGHIAVGAANADDDDAEFLVGTAVPDFASMARTRLRGAAPGTLADGITLHHATDRAFHADAWFLTLERDLRAGLLDDGLPDGGARACAHVGVELLLDGALVRERTVHDAVGRVYEGIGEPSDAVVELATPQERVRWHEHLVGISRRLDPTSYGDADAVGRRLHTITSRRPRLAFPSSMVDAVSARLQALQPRIRDDAPTVLRRMTRATRAPRRRAHAPR
jgi:acyl carrier protein phosphodiesterase